MTTRRTFMLIGSCATAATLGGCGDRVRKRFKATLVIEVDGEQRSASSVFEFFVPFKLGEGAALAYVIGTAPIVDLGRYGHVYWSLGNRTTSPASLLVAPSAIYLKGAERFNYTKIETAGAEPRDLVTQKGPLLVWVPLGIANYNSGSIQIVSDPMQLGRAIGNANVRLIRATIEPSNERLKPQVDQPPLWLIEWRKAQTGTHDVERSTGW